MTRGSALHDPDKPRPPVLSETQERWVRTLQGRANSGGAAAGLLLAHEHSKGRFLHRSHAEELRWTHIAAKEGHACAQNNLAVLYLRKALSTRRRARQAAPSASTLPFRWRCTARCRVGGGLELRALEGLACRECLLRQRALAWLQLASSHGSYAASLNLATLLLAWPHRDAVQVNHALAVLQEAGDKGHAEALYRMGDLYARGVEALGIGCDPLLAKDMARARTCYAAAAELGHGKAALEVATALLEEGMQAGSGRRCPSKEWPAKAHRLLVLAAGQGVEEAQMLLARWLLEGGRGVERDEEQAVRWYAAAADQHGNSEAQAYMALCYELGDVVEEDLTKALAYYRKAAEQDHPEALFSLGEHSTYFEEARRWYGKAAAQGHANALWRLAGLYSTGIHRPQVPTRRSKKSPAFLEAQAAARRDPGLAFTLASEAAALGSSEALQHLTALRQAAALHESAAPAEAQARSNSPPDEVAFAEAAPIDAMDIIAVHPTGTRAAPVSL